MPVVSAIRRPAALLAAVLATPALAAPPLAELVKQPMFSGASISPDGKHLAMTVPRGDQDALAILRTADLSLIKLHVLPEKASFANYGWTGDERIIFSTAMKRGGFAAPAGTGNLYALDIDGSRNRELFSETLGMGRATAGASKRSSPYEFASLLDALPDEPRRALIQINRAGSPDGQLAEVAEIDTFTGRRKRLLSGPRPSCGFVLDPESEVRFANCGDEQGNSLLYRRDDNEWTLVNDSGKSGKRTSVSLITRDGRVWARHDDLKAPAAMGWLAADGSFTEVHRDGVSDVMGTITSLDGTEPLAVFSMPDRPRIHFIESEHKDAALLQSLVAAFPGQYVGVASAGRQGRFAILTVSSDRDPGSYYLYDRESGQARFLTATRPWIDPSRMAEVRPFSMKARDGQTLYGYLTIPPGREPRKLPMVVNPHGGPHGPRDTWGYSRDTQVLASRGYLVLQINFRGSGGYGEAFMEAGYREWGGKIQEDIIDATRHAIDEGWADGKRVCIYGASFGAYSAVMSAILEPDLYQCAIGNAGVYDLTLLFEEGDVQQRRSGENYLGKVLGSDPALLNAHSPARRVDELEAPVFIIHGRKDVRAPIDHADALREALTEDGHHYEWLVEDDEAHGFYDEKNLVGMYEKVFAFLARHIGPGSEGTVGKPEPSAP